MRPRFVNSAVAAVERSPTSRAMPPGRQRATASVNRNVIPSPSRLINCISSCSDPARAGDAISAGARSRNTMLTTFAAGMCRSAGRRMFIGIESRTRSRAALHADGGSASAIALSKAAAAASPNSR